MTKKIWVSVSTDNQGYIERCDMCGVTQPDTATAFRQLHYDDCPIAPPPSDFLERIEELNHRNEDPEPNAENRRIESLQKIVRKVAEEKEGLERAELNRKIREGELIAATRMSDPHREVKEQIGFLESAIKGQNQEFLRIQVQWAQALILKNDSLGNNAFRQELKRKIDDAVQLMDKLSLDSQLEHPRNT